MVIKVCVGSSCHLKGSYGVIEKLKEIVKKYNLENDVELCASFCLGQCSKGVSVTADDNFLENVTPENVEEIFCKDVMPKIKSL